MFVRKKILYILMYVLIRVILKTWYPPVCVWDCLIKLKFLCWYLSQSCFQLWVFFCGIMYIVFVLIHIFAIHWPLLLFGLAAFWSTKFFKKKVNRFVIWGLYLLWRALKKEFHATPFITKGWKFFWICLVIPKDVFFWWGSRPKR